VPGAKHVVLSSILANPTAQKFQDRTVFVCQAGERSASPRRWPWRWASKDVVNFRAAQGVERCRPAAGKTMSEQPRVTTQIAPDATVKPEDVIEVLRQCFDPEIPVKHHRPRAGVRHRDQARTRRLKMTLTALGCPMARTDVRRADHLLTLPRHRRRERTSCTNPSGPQSACPKRRAGTGDGLTPGPRRQLRPVAPNGALEKYLKRSVGYNVRNRCQAGRNCVHYT